MEDMDLHSCHKRHKSKSLTNSKRARGDGYPNILRYYEFPISPRKGLTSDITYLKTSERFMYHCIIKDIVTGEILGDHMAQRMTKELVIKTILSMLARHKIEKAYCDNLEQMLKQGVWLKHMIAPLLGLYKGQPNAKRWRRQLVEKSREPNAGTNIITHALDCMLA